MNAAEAIASLLVVTGIPDLPFWMLCVRHVILLIEISGDAGGIEYHLAAVIKKKPLRQGRRGCFFSSHSAAVCRPGGASAADIAADDLAEQIPLLAVELHQLKLSDRGEVS